MSDRLHRIASLVTLVVAGVLVLVAGVCVGASAYLLAILPIAGFVALMVLGRTYGFIAPTTNRKELVLSILSGLLLFGAGAAFTAGLPLVSLTCLAVFIVLAFSDRKKTADQPASTQPTE